MSDQAASSLSDEQLHFLNLVSESIHAYVDMDKKQYAEIRETTSVYITRDVIFLLPEVLDIIQTLIQFLCRVQECHL